MDLIEECLSDNAREQMEQYNRDKFNEIQKKVENKKQNIKIDEKLKDEFSKIVDKALKLAERLCLNIRTLSINQFYKDNLFIATIIHLFTRCFL